MMKIENKKIEIATKIFIVLSLIGCFVFGIFNVWANYFDGYNEKYDVIQIVSFVFATLCCIMFSTLFPLYYKFIRNIGCEKEKLNINNYYELINIINNNKNIEKVYDKHKVLIYKYYYNNMDNFIILRNYKMITDFEVSKLYEIFNKFILDYYNGNNKVRIGVIPIVCVEKNSERFIKYVESGSEQDKLLSQLVTGISFENKSLYISKLVDDKDIEQYNEIKDTFNSLFKFD